ncbi:hypothetical protein GCM10017752_12000 [Streptomyces roseoviridis]
MDVEAVPAQVVDGLPGAAHAVVLGAGQPVQALDAGDRLELLCCEVPVGEVRFRVRGGGGDESVLGVLAEVEVLLQEDSFPRAVSDAWAWWRPGPARQAGRGRA